MGPERSFSIILSFHRWEDQDPERCSVKNEYLIDQSTSAGKKRMKKRGKLTEDQNPQAVALKDISPALFFLRLPRMTWHLY